MTTYEVNGRSEGGLRVSHPGPLHSVLYLGLVGSGTHTDNYGIGLSMRVQGRKYSSGYGSLKLFWCLEGLFNLCRPLKVLDVFIIIRERF